LLCPVGRTILWVKWAISRGSKDYRSGAMKARRDLENITACFFEYGTARKWTWVMDAKIRGHLAKPTIANHFMDWTLGSFHWPRVFRSRAYHRVMFPLMGERTGKRAIGKPGEGQALARFYLRYRLAGWRAVVLQSVPATILPGTSSRQKRRLREVRGLNSIFTTTAPGLWWVQIQWER